VYAIRESELYIYLQSHGLPPQTRGGGRLFITQSPIFSDIIG